MFIHVSSNHYLSECRSSFNLNRSALNSPNGLVRCGACLAVFKASEHFFESDTIRKFQRRISIYVKEPIDYFNPVDFLKLEDLNGNDETCSNESKYGNNKILFLVFFCLPLKLLQS